MLTGCDHGHNKVIFRADTWVGFVSPSLTLVSHFHSNSVVQIPLITVYIFWELPSYVIVSSVDHTTCIWPLPTARQKVKLISKSVIFTWEDSSLVAYAHTELEMALNSNRKWQDISIRPFWWQSGEQKFSLGILCDASKVLCDKCQAPSFTWKTNHKSQVRPSDNHQVNESQI